MTKTILLSIVAAVCIQSQLMAAGPDLSSPKAAAKSLYSAVEASDREALRQIMKPQQESQQSYIDAIVDMILSAKKLGDAASAKFGASGEAFARGMIDSKDIAKVDAAKVSEADGVTTVLVPGQTIPLKFTAKDGVWHLLVIDATVADRLAQQESLCRKLTALFGDLSAEIVAGKFATANDAEQAMSQRMHAILAAAAQGAKGGGPTTRP